MAQLKFPHEWLQVQLGDIVSYGKTQKCELSDVTDDTWVLELEDIEKESSRIISRKTATERPFKSTKNQFERGNVLYGKLRPYLNKVVVADTDGVCTTEIIPLDSEPFALNRYLFHWLKTRDFLNYVNEVSYGVNMPRLGTKDGVAAPFVLAPLAEQKVIADKLDTLLAQVENTKARLERIPQILKRFRQSVLSAAVSGRLTEEWRERKPGIRKPRLSEIKEHWLNAYRAAGKKLPKPQAVNDLESRVVPNSWLETRIGQVFDVFVGSTPSRSRPDFWNGEIPWVSSSEVAFCRISSTREHITESGLASASTTVHPVGTVMLAMIGQGKTRGQVAILGIPACHNQNTAALRVPEEFVVPDYLYHYLVKQYEETRRIGGGNNQKALNKRFVQSMAFPLPSLEEQTEIVRQVDQLFAHADRIEQQVNNALDRVNNLTQSILAKAFRGELTEQWRKDNPELIRGENSAEALLERIKAERAAVAKPKSRKTEARTP